MPKIAFFDTKQYDRDTFDPILKGFDVTYYDTKLVARSARLGAGFDAVCAFVNDDIDSDVIDMLAEGGVKLIAMRSAGYSNVDISAAEERGICVVRVPGIFAECGRRTRNGAASCGKPPYTACVYPYPRFQFQSERFVRY